MYFENCLMLMSHFSFWYWRYTEIMFKVVCRTSFQRYDEAVLQILELSTVTEEKARTKDLWNRSLVDVFEWNNLLFLFGMCI